MNLINEFGIKPGPYHLRQETIVVIDVITHQDSGGKVTQLEEPLVMYRPLIAPKGHVEGKPTELYQRMVMPLSEFKAMNLKEI